MSKPWDSLVDDGCFNVKDAARRRDCWLTVSLHKEGVRIEGCLPRSADRDRAIALARALMDMAKEALLCCWTEEPTLLDVVGPADSEDDG